MVAAVREKRLRAIPAVFAIVAFAAFAHACGGGGGGKSLDLLVIDQNVLHGIGNEDPAAGKYARFPERVQLLASALADARPDVVTLQEILASPGPDYPNARQIVLSALGSDYKAIFGNFSGAPIDSGGLGQMTFTRLPILSSENRTVSAIRSVHHVAVQTELGTVDIYNAHLEGTGAVLPTGADASVVEVDNIIAFVRETRSGPVILAGDFNAKPDEPSIRAIIDKGGFIDTLATAGDATCDKAGDPGCSNSTMPLGDNPENPADHRIDYIFVLPSDNVSVEVKAATRFHDTPADLGNGHTLWISDHIGMQARLVLKKR